MTAYVASHIQDRYLGFYKSLLENHLPLTPAFVLLDRDERGLLIDVEIQ
ncbi:hypothetical protein ACFQZR_00930 [Paenibacillus sp. GCM10027629]